VAVRELIFLLAGALIGWATAHAYYRKTRRDLAVLRADVERIVADGIVTAVRDARGQIKGLAPPSAPTSFKLS
jgi:hypothetical protein